MIQLLENQREGVVNAVHINVALKRVDKKKDIYGRELLDYIIKNHLQEVLDMKGYQIVAFLTVAAQSNLLEKDVVGKICEQIAFSVADLHLPQIVQAISKLKFYEIGESKIWRPLLDTLCKRVERKEGVMTLSQLAATINSAAKFRVRCSRIIVLYQLQMLQIAQNKLSDISPSHCFALVNGMLKMEVEGKEGAKAIHLVNQVVLKESDFVERSGWTLELLTSLLLGLTKLSVRRNEEMLEHVAERVQQPGLDWNINLVVRLLMAYSQFSWRNAALLDWTAQFILANKKGEQMDLKTVFKAAESYGKLGCQNQELISQLKQKIIDSTKQDQFPPNMLGTILISFQNLNSLSQDLIDAIIESTKRQKQNLEPKTILIFTQVLGRLADQEKSIQLFIEDQLFEYTNNNFQKFQSTQILRLIQNINLSQNLYDKKLISGCINQFLENPSFKNWQIFHEILSWLNKFGQYEEEFLDKGVEIILNQINKNNKNNITLDISQLDLKTLVSITQNLSQLRYHNYDYMQNFAIFILNNKAQLNPHNIFQIFVSFSFLFHENHDLFQFLKQQSLIFQENFSNFQKLSILKAMCTMDEWDVLWWQPFTQNLTTKNLELHQNQLFFLQQILFSQPKITQKFQYIPFIKELLDYNCEEIDQLLDQKPKISKFQRQVFTTLQGLGYDPQPEHPISSQISRTTDIALLDVEQDKIAVEVDGEHHFARNAPFLPLGRTVLSTKILQGCGWHVIRVNQNEWEEAYKLGRCEKLLEERILQCVGVIVFPEMQ